MADLKVKTQRVNELEVAVVTLNEKIALMQTTFDTRLENLVQSSKIDSEKAQNILIEKNQSLDKKNLLLMSQLDSTVQALKALEETVDTMQNKMSKERENKVGIEGKLKLATLEMVNMKKQLILDQEMLSNSNMKVEELESRLINYESTYTIEKEDLVADVKIYESKIASFENERLKQMDKFNKLQQAFCQVTVGKRPK